MGAVKEAEVAALHAVLDGKSVELAVGNSADGKSLVIEASVPVEVLKDLWGGISEDDGQVRRSVRSRKRVLPRGQTELLRSWRQTLPGGGCRG
jgi:hypothetical protein